MVTGSVTSTFAAPPNYEWTVQSGTVSIDGTLSLTSDEIAFRPPDDRVQVRARLMSWESRADMPGVMTGTAAVHYASDTLVGNPVLEGCLEADNVLRECSGMRRQRGGPVSSSMRRDFLLRLGPSGGNPRRQEGHRRDRGAGSPVSLGRKTAAGEARRVSLAAPPHHWSAVRTGQDGYERRASRVWCATGPLVMERGLGDDALVSGLRNA